MSESANTPKLASEIFMEEAFSENFTFFPSYWRAIKDSSEHDKAEILTLFCTLAFEGKELDTSNSSEVVRTLYLVASETIKSGMKKRLKGKLGGAPKDNKNAAKTT